MLYFVVIPLLAMSCESEEEGSETTLRSSYLAGQCGEVGDKFCPSDPGISAVTKDSCQRAKMDSKCGGLYVDYLLCLGEHTTCVDGKASLPTGAGQPCEQSLSTHLKCKLVDFCRSFWSGRCFEVSMRGAWGGVVSGPVWEEAQVRTRPGARRACANYADLARLSRTLAVRTRWLRSWPRVPPAEQAQGLRGCFSTGASGRPPGSYGVRLRRCPGHRCSCGLATRSRRLDAGATTRPTTRPSDRAAGPPHGGSRDR